MKSRLMTRIVAFFKGGRMILIKNPETGNITPAVSYVDPFGELVADFQRNSRSNKIVVKLKESNKKFRIVKKNSYGLQSGYEEEITEFIWTYGPDDIGNFKNIFSSNNKQETKETK